MFGQTIRLVEDTGPQLGGSYVMAAVQFVPGVLAPRKADFVWDMRADRFVPKYCGRGLRDLSWPAGFYGEGYMNFGLIGLIIVSLGFGRLTQYAERLLRTPGVSLGIPHWYIGALLTGGLAVGVRMDAAMILSSVAPQVALIAGLQYLWRLSADAKQYYASKSLKVVNTAQNVSLATAYSDAELSANKDWIPIR
jgi:hypothetical protein